MKTVGRLLANCQLTVGPQLARDVKIFTLPVVEYGYFLE